MVVARELTKVFEEFFRGTTQEACEYFQKKTPKGEFVLMLGSENRHNKKRYESEETEDSSEAFDQE